MDDMEYEHDGIDAEDGAAVDDGAEQEDAQRQQDGYQRAEWDQRPDETDKAFAAFVAYREQGRGRRSIRALSDQIGKNDSMLEKWSSKYSWTYRAREYDKEIDRRAMAAAVEDRRSMYTRHSEYAAQLINKGVEGLRLKEPSELSPKECREYIRAGCELERAARGMELSEHKQRKKEINNVFDTLIDNML